MKGIGKALSRTPFAVTTKIGMAKRSADTEFDEYARHFGNLESAADKLIKDTKAFCDAVTALFTSGDGYATHYSVIMTPIAGEYDLIGKHPDSGHTIRSQDHYAQAMKELKELIGPELELIESRIMGPAKEIQVVMKTIRKTITKREHKLTDYDRYNNSLTKLRDKKDKSLSDEKNLFKASPAILCLELEQDFEVATNEYDYINTALKQDLPRFMMLATQFIDPLFSSFFYMQLNVYYLLLEKMNSFADENKWDVANTSGAQIAGEYEEKRTDAWQRIEDLGVVKRIVSVSRLVQASRAQNGGAPGSLGRSNTTASSSSSLKPAAPPSRSTSSASGYKKAPPPPPSLGGSRGLSPRAEPAPPPPYTASSSVGSTTLAAAAAKRAPPPPPPLKPKPGLKPKPQIQYVVALYDFAAQADGDLSFNTGDRIELIQKSESAEDWWTGRLNGVQGVFPGKFLYKNSFQS
ncbi:hypothetical protein CPB83DRAFT_754324 [Crepidotus variabilis]|uniref:BAR-domain-containing protein n=1 Tax=Crepidotus variabilis TaxID=179855 RepID=A0A9P6JWK4_9AGAR|nr:hypothetical protein CPB83DRAFT_754324 [Crepidotus variabilis]